MSINRPSWVHSWAEMVQPINRDLLQRLNSDAQLSGGMWTIDATQMGLSRPGAHRIIWAIEGGSIEAQASGAGARHAGAMWAIRKLRLAGRDPHRFAAEPSWHRPAYRCRHRGRDPARVMIIPGQHRPADFDS